MLCRAVPVVSAHQHMLCCALVVSAQQHSTSTGAVSNAVLGHEFEKA
jgi:hypothetical protein